MTLCAVKNTYDAANNLGLEVSITDSKYLKSFLLYLSSVVKENAGVWLAKAGDTIRDFSRSIIFWKTNTEPDNITS